MRGRAKSDGEGSSNGVSSMTKSWRVKDMGTRTLSAISKFQMGRLLRRTKGIEHLGPLTPEPKGEEETQTQTNQRTNGCMCPYLIASANQCIPVRFFQVMLEVLFRELADVLACILAENGERVGGHGRMYENAPDFI